MENKNYPELMIHHFLKFKYIFKPDTQINYSLNYDFHQLISKIMI